MKINKTAENHHFELTVTGTSNNEWQGILQTPQGAVLVFNSVIELLKEIGAEVDSENNIKNK